MKKKLVDNIILVIPITIVAITLFINIFCILRKNNINI